MSGKPKKITLSIKSLNIMIFVAFMVLTVMLVSYLIYWKWISTISNSSSQIALEENRDVYQQIDAIISKHTFMNEVNKRLIANHIIDLSQAEERDKLLKGVMQTYQGSITRFSYATEAGEYYTIDEDYVVGEVDGNINEFDPRNILWYKSAKEKGKPVYSTGYKSISISWPIYDKAGNFHGVTSTEVLLTDIDEFLSDTIKHKTGYALIVDKNSGVIVASSSNLQNFEDIDNTTNDELRFLGEAYQRYHTKNEINFRQHSSQANYFIDFKEFSLEGINWVIITAVPDDILMNELRSSIIVSALLVILAVLASCYIYLILTKKILGPFNRLVKVNEEFSSGDLTVRSDYKRNDELGKLATAFNQMADTIHNLVDNLETTVKERTVDLKESKDQLRLILDSTAEGIYGVDKEGNCTFCNVSCMDILGYTSEEILGKNMHDLIHHMTKDGKKLLVTDCEIYKAILKKEKNHVVGEVFWKADGTFVEVEYYSYPQFVNEEVVGAVVTFMDITERKKNEMQIKYLSSHDSLTGLLNRHSFEKALKEWDTVDNLPISIIFADVNALKLLNDIYGHTAGDLLIQKAANVLKRSCRVGDIVARVGGDEFIILLPRTSSDDAVNIMERVRIELEKEYVNSIQCSMALGVDTKVTPMQDIERTMGNAENQMYIEKTIIRHKLGVEAIDGFISTLHQKNDLEKSHSERVSQLCESMGIALGLSETEIYRLKEAGYLHDIGKIVLDDNLLSKGNVLTDDETKEVQRHTAVGYRILNMFDSKLDLAEGIYAHHEKWDGTGYPKGLKGEEIPLASRIIAIAETYERIRVRSSREESIRELREMSGSFFDPELTEIFIQKTS